MSEAIEVVIRTPPVDLGVSREALAMARLIDRQPAGEAFSLRIEKKPLEQGGGFTYELVEETTRAAGEFPRRSPFA